MNTEKAAEELIALSRRYVEIGVEHFSPYTESWTEKQKQAERELLRARFLFPDASENTLNQLATIAHEKQLALDKPEGSGEEYVKRQIALRAPIGNTLHRFSPLQREVLTRFYFCD